MPYAPAPSRARLVVAGFGMVGHKLVERLAALGAIWRYDVTIVGEEQHPAYDRVRLTEWHHGRRCHPHSGALKTHAGETVTLLAFCLPIEVLRAE